MKRSGSRLLAALYYHSFKYSPHNAKEKKTHKFNIKWEMDGQYYNLWSTDNDKTDNNDDVVIKTVYDPSPVGYSLPATNAFTGFTTTGQNVEDSNINLWNIKGNYDRGYYFYTKLNRLGNIFFIPTSGLRNYNSGNIKFFLEGGYIWQAGPKSNKEARVFGFHNHSIWVLGDNIRSHSRTVRSAEERETHKFNTKWEMDGKYYNLWSTDNDKTVPNDDVVIKSVYDPQPRRIFSSGIQCLHGVHHDRAECR